MAKKKYLKDVPLKRDDSKDQILNYSFSTSSQTVFPNFNLSKVTEMMDNDPVARGAFSAYVDKCMEGGYSILKRNTKELDEAEQLRMEEKWMFNTKVLRKLFIQLKLYNNAFVEIIRNSKKEVTDVNVLDTENIEPITEPNGDPVMYKSRSIPAGSNEQPTWDEEEIVWYKLNDVSRGWAPVDLKALYTTLLTKEYVLRFMAWLWKTGQYRLTYQFNSGVANRDINDFLAMARKLDFDFSKPSIYKGEGVAQVLRGMQENESAVKMLEYLDQQILISMRIPGIDAGFMNSGSRSDTDGAKSTLSTHVKSVKSIIADYTNFTLFPRINKSNSFLLFKPTDRLDTAKILDMVTVMSNLGMTDQAKKELLVQEGLAFSGKEWFKPDEDKPTRSTTGQALGAESREGKTEGDMNEQIGTGEESTTRQDQMEE